MRYEYNLYGCKPQHRDSNLGPFHSVVELVDRGLYSKNTLYVEGRCSNIDSWSCQQRKEHAHGITACGTKYYYDDCIQLYYAERLRDSEIGFPEQS